MESGVHTAQGKSSSLGKQVQNTSEHSEACELVLLTLTQGAQVKEEEKK